MRLFHRASAFWVFGLALVLAAGCGEPAAPPAGAPKETTAPQVEVGSETTPVSSAADPGEPPALPGGN